MIIWLYLIFHFLGVIYFHCGTKNPKIIVDGHDFYLEKRKETKTHWFCCSNSSTRCKVRVTTSGKMVQVNGTHNHSPKKTKFSNLQSKHVTILRINQKKILISNEILQMSWFHSVKHMQRYLAYYVTEILQIKFWFPQN